MQDRPKICPCEYHHREVREDGHCLCHLFVSETYSPETAYQPESGDGSLAEVKSIRHRWVSVYCTSWCFHSRMTKQLLGQHGVPFINIDIEQDEEAAKQVEAWNKGLRSVPTLVIRLILTEPSIAELERILLSPELRFLECDAYVTSWSPDSRRVRAWLERNEIPCTFIDIDEDEEAAKKVEEWNDGFRSVPTLDVRLRMTEPSSQGVRAVLGLENSAA
ncbi:MAG: hypothetical protein A2Y73_01445 [Chloroflexi bacterium RBG_13_56_8]|nr:MAG: hypothetical protein A2Y73_01445 [Chloroflexi bacterium RBG_13_56_8]